MQPYGCLSAAKRADRAPRIGGRTHGGHQAPVRDIAAPAATCSPPSPRSTACAAGGPRTPGATPSPGGQLAFHFGGEEPAAVMEVARVGARRAGGLALQPRAPTSWVGHHLHLRHLPRRRGDHAHCSPTAAGGSRARSCTTAAPSGRTSCSACGPTLEGGRVVAFPNDARHQTPGADVPAPAAGRDRPARRPGRRDWTPPSGPWPTRPAGGCSTRCTDRNGQTLTSCARACTCPASRSPSTCGILEAALLVTTTRRGRHEVCTTSTPRRSTTSASGGSTATSGPVSTPWPISNEHWRNPPWTPPDRTEFRYVTYIRTTPDRAVAGPHRPGVHRPVVAGHGLRLRPGPPGSPMTWHHHGTTIVHPDQVVLGRRPTASAVLHLAHLHAPSGPTPSDSTRTCGRPSTPSRGRRPPSTSSPRANSSN